MNKITKQKLRAKPVVLVILDGLGISNMTEGNAVKLANTPNLKKLWSIYPNTLLEASGNYVGLPQGVQGNSEVGHMCIGAGRIVFQEVAKIDQAMDSGDFFENKVFLNAIDHVKKNKSRLHFMGLLSDGKVHSSMEHLYKSLELCKKKKLKKDQVLIHVFTDGRDTPPSSAKKYIAELESEMARLEVGQIASIVGRYFAMDRDDRWERTQLAYKLLTEGIGIQALSAQDAVDASYKYDTTDEYMKPYVIVQNDKPVGIIEDGDTLIFFNYRGDRAVQLSQAFESEDFAHFKLKGYKNLFFAGFSNYQKGLPTNRSEEESGANESQFVKEGFKAELSSTKFDFPKNQIFPPDVVDEPLGSVISQAGLSQLRLSESEKFPHVTYFFNCRSRNPYPNEDRIEVPSPKDVATYDQKPEMSSYEITEQFLRAVESGKYDFILVNYALTDMVAHTGNLKASIRAVEVADECVGKIVPAVLAKGGELLITADHGNIEEMINLVTKAVDTKHSTNPVPLIFVANGIKRKEISPGMLADIAPTLLSRLGVKLNANMTGRDLLS